MSLFTQFIDGYGRPCAYAATSGLSLEVPQTQFIARAGGHSSYRDSGLRRGSGGDEGWAFFALLWVVPELSASFRSPR